MAEANSSGVCAGVFVIPRRSMALSMRKYQKLAAVLGACCGFLATLTWRKERHKRGVNGRAARTSSRATSEAIFFQESCAPSTLFRRISKRRYFIHDQKRTRV